MKYIHGKTGELQISFLLPLVVLYQGDFLSFNKCAVVIEDVHGEAGGRL